MEYVIAAFQTRGNALKFYNILRSKGLDVYVISTPKIRGLGCGISIKMKSADFPYAKAIMEAYNMSDFLGFYQIKKQNGKLVANKL